MSLERRIAFTKEDIDTFLKAVAKAYRRQIGKGMPAELILIGGASVLLNYGFRESTTDIDALIHAASAMQDAISTVADQYDLPQDWLNADFVKTVSYTPKLAQFSVYYRTYANILTIRTVSAEYLIAMKLRSGRQYKSDLSDVIGILAEHNKRGQPISLSQVVKAAADLYGDWKALPEASRLFIENVMQAEQIGALYEGIVREEKETKELLIRFGQEYPGIMKEQNADRIARNLQKKADRESILAQLRAAQDQQSQEPVSSSGLRNGADGSSMR